MKYLIDTDICIAVLKNQYGMRAKIQEIGKDNIVVCDITIAEMYYGAYKSGQERHLRDVENVKRLFEVKNSCGSFQLYGRNKAFLESQGTRIEDLDLMIGSTAVDNGFVMVTGNVKHYGRIPDIKIENWFPTDRSNK